MDMTVHFERLANKPFRNGHGESSSKSKASNQGGRTVERGVRKVGVRPGGPRVVAGRGSLFFNIAEMSGNGNRNIFPLLVNFEVYI